MQSVAEEGQTQGVDIEEMIWNERYAMECIMFVIVENESGKTIGFCELENISTDEPTIGIDISKEYRGKGYGYLAAKAMIEECWKIFPHQYFIWEARKENIASKKLVIKLGGVLINHRASLRGDVLDLLKENGFEAFSSDLDLAIERYKITRPKVESKVK